VQEILILLTARGSLIGQQNLRHCNVFRAMLKSKDEPSFAFNPMCHRSRKATSIGLSAVHRSENGSADRVQYKESHTAVGHLRILMNNLDAQIPYDQPSTVTDAGEG
jgi:hypothetical protein